MEEKELKILKKEHQKYNKIKIEIYERIEALKSSLQNDKYPPKKGEYETTGEWKAHLETWILNRNESRRLIERLKGESHKVCEGMGKIFVPVKDHFISQITHENPDMDEPEADVRAGRRTEKFLEE